MNIIETSIKRPVFITCLFLFTIVLGFISLQKINVDLFPEVTFPTVSVVTDYKGASPEEIEYLITKPLEDAVSSIGGIETLKSVSLDESSVIIVNFKLGTDIKYAQQQVRDKISAASDLLPSNLEKQPVIQVLDFNAKPISLLAVTADLDDAKLYDLADRVLVPSLSAIDGVGQVKILGGRKREIHVFVDEKSLKQRNLSTATIMNAISKTGENVPAGSFEAGGFNKNLRVIGQYKDPQDILEVPISFYGNEALTKVKDIATVEDGLQERTSYAKLNGKSVITIEIYKSSDANTVSVANSIKSFLTTSKAKFERQYKSFDIKEIKDESRKIRNNIIDVKESIIIGLILTIAGVYLFLGNLRSTLITASALPNSLICAFLIMYLAGFTINIMTLLAMSLSVGLLIDDAIVVRENIFRQIENGKDAKTAALLGAKQILLPVVATTFALVGVFLPIAFLDGIVGQFFKQFGLTVCFILLISLADALMVGPMLSAYFGVSKSNKKGLISKMDDFVKNISDKLNNWMLKKYDILLKFAIKRFILTILLSLAFIFSGFFLVKMVPKTFIKNSDNGEFNIEIELTSGTNLSTTNRIATQIDEMLHKRNDIDFTLASSGGAALKDSNIASIFVRLVDKKNRKLTTKEVREEVRLEIEKIKEISSFGVTDSDNVGGGGVSKKNTGVFAINIAGPDLEELKELAFNLLEKLKTNPDLQDLDITYRKGRPEIQISSGNTNVEKFGLLSKNTGEELKNLVSGGLSGKYRENGYEYDIYVRLDEDKRNVERDFSQISIPNINMRKISLSDATEMKQTFSPSSIYRSDRMKYIAITASENPKGPGGLGKAMSDTTKILDEELLKNHPNISYEFDGQAKRFKELGIAILQALLMSIIFMYLILASLYESFRQPLIILSIIPLAISGGFYGLYITGAYLDLFAQIGCIMLIGLCAKNSILLVDCVNELKSQQNLNTIDAVIEAGKLRLRPIVMTSIVLIAGMLPVAIGLNEASQQRTSMGIIIIGGLISSTLLTLVFLPAVYSLIEHLKTKKK